MLQSLALAALTLTDLTIEAVAGPQHPPGMVNIVDVPGTAQALLTAIIQNQEDLPENAIALKRRWWTQQADWTVDCGRGGSTSRGWCFQMSGVSCLRGDRRVDRDAGCRRVPCER